MATKEKDFRDPVVERVVDKFISRSDVGYKKYGVTLDADPSGLSEWINHLQEELMDAVLYLQKVKETCGCKNAIQTGTVNNIDVIDAQEF